MPYTYSKDDFDEREDFLASNEVEQEEEEEEEEEEKEDDDEEEGWKIKLNLVKKARKISYNNVYRLIDYVHVFFILGLTDISLLSL